MGFGRFFTDKGGFGMDGGVFVTEWQENDVKVRSRLSRDEKVGCVEWYYWDGEE